MTDLRQRLRSGYLLLDGAMGTQLQAAGLKLGELPELLCFTDPAVVANIHRRYIAAGSQVIYANTFQANGYKLKNSGYTPAQVITKGIQLAQDAAAGTETYVAFDCGPIGQLLEPLGTLSFEDAYELYREMVVAAQDAGADLIVFETFTDLYDMKAAVLAAKEHTHLPILATMSFEGNGRTFTGTTVPAMAMTLEGLGVDAVGFNCSLGPAEILSLAEELRQWTDLPLVVKPNAGLPDPQTNEYTITAAEFAREMVPFTQLGVRILGGCCGTSPAFIQELRHAIGTQPPEVTRPPKRRGVCSASQVAELTGVRVVGERINPTGKKRFQQALREHDLDYILNQAMSQQDAGADILDVNVGLPGIDEVAMMTDVVKAIQSVVSLPLQIDSTNPEVIEAGLRACCRTSHRQLGQRQGGDFGGHPAHREEVRRCRGGAGHGRERPAGDGTAAV